MAEVSDNGDEPFVTVVYALRDAQYVVAVAYEDGLTAAEAVRRSGLTDRFPEIAARPLTLGSFGRVAEPEMKLKCGARVEICRPLQRDPRELRRIMTSQGMVVGQREEDGS